MLPGLYDPDDKGVYRMRGGEAVKIIAVSGSEGMAVGCGDEDA